MQAKYTQLINVYNYRKVSYFLKYPLKFWQEYFIFKCDSVQSRTYIIVSISACEAVGISQMN